MLKIQEGIGEKLGLFISHSSFVAWNLICAFYYGWELASITLTTVLALTVAVGILARVQSLLLVRETKAYASAGSLAQEVIGAIKTVTMFRAQENEVGRFKTSLKQARKNGIKQGLVTAVGNCAVWTFMYSSYALSFWYGIRLVLQSVLCTETNARYDAGTLNMCVIKIEKSRNLQFISFIILVFSSPYSILP